MLILQSPLSYWMVCAFFFLLLLAFLLQYKETNYFYLFMSLELTHEFLQILEKTPSRLKRIRNWKVRCIIIFRPIVWS